MIFEYIAYFEIHPSLYLHHQHYSLVGKVPVACWRMAATPRDPSHHCIFITNIALVWKFLVACGRDGSNTLSPSTTVDPLANTSHISAILEVDSELQVLATGPIDNSTVCAHNWGLHKCAIVPLCITVKGFLLQLVVVGGIVDTEAKVIIGAIEGSSWERGLAGSREGERSGKPAAALIKSLLNHLEIGLLVINTNAELRVYEIRCSGDGSAWEGGSNVGLDAPTIYGSLVKHISTLNPIALAYCHNRTLE